ncbi:MAG: hypothetical protein ACK5AO_00455 [bacterium]|jgi:hypothetical protein
MKLISNKYLLALLLAIVVLVGTVSYMSYDVIIAQPISKTPEEIIDSLKFELRSRDSIILRMSSRLNSNDVIIDIQSIQQTKINSSSAIRSADQLIDNTAMSSSQKEKSKSVSETPVFVGF